MALPRLPNPFGSLWVSWGEALIRVLQPWMTTVNSRLDEISAVSSVSVSDEGTPVVSPASVLDFAGPGVSVAAGGPGVAVVTIPGPTWTTIRKTSDTARSSDTTLTADPALNIALQSGKTYHIRGHVRISSNGTGDQKFSVSYTGTTSSAYTYYNYINLTGPSTATASAGATENLVGSQAVVVSAAFTVIVEISVILTTTSAGTFDFNWAQNVSDVGATTVRAGSYLEWMEAS